MSLMSALSGADLTKIRGGGYRAQQFVCLCPNTVVVQFQPSAAPSADTYAQISVGTVASGTMSNVKPGMLVIYSDTADFYETERYRIYVRKVSGTSTLFVGQNSQALSTGDYVTVLDTYEVFERPRVSRSDVEFADWDIAFRRLLPVETALPTAVVLSRGVTSYSPAASPAALDADATASFTHAWESSNSNDTLDAGGTTATPTFTLEAGAFRWIRYTFTDSNGNSNYRVQAVWTVPTDYSNAVALGFIGGSGDVAAINYDAQLGWSANVISFADVTDILPGTFCAVWSDEWYQGVHGSIRTNIDLCGYLARESTDQRGDETHGAIGEAQFSIEGFGTIMGRTPVSTLLIDNVDSPSEWGDIKSPTPVRACGYILTEHSTITNLCAVSFFSDHTSFVGDGDVFYNDIDVLLDAIAAQLRTVNAVVQFDRDGRLDIVRRLTFLDDTARNAAPVVAAIDPADMLDFRIEFEPIKTTRLLTTTGGVYNTTDDSYTVYRAYAPVNADVRGIDEPEVVDQVLTTNSSLANAQAELGQRTANGYAALNPTYRMIVRLKDEWAFLVPDASAWYTFAIATTDTVRGKTFTASQRWQLVQINYSTNNESARRGAGVSAEFRLETQNTGALITVSVLESDPEADTNPLPAVLPPFSGGDTDLVDDYFDSLDPTPPSSPNPGGADCETIGFRVAGVGSASTQRGALNGENLQITLSGYGAVRAGTGPSFDGSFVGGVANDFAAGGTALDPVGTLTSAGWEDTLGTDSYRGVQISRTLDTPVYIEDMSFVFDRTKGDSPQFTPVRMVLYLNGSQVYFGSSTPNAEGTNLTWSATSVNELADEIQILCVCGNNFGPNNDPGGSSTVKSFEVNGTTLNGDAFYYYTEDDVATPYGAGNGALINGSQPGSIPPYNSAHQYTITSVGNGAPVQVSYEPEFGTAGLSNWSLQAQVCFLGVP